MIEFDKDRIIVGGYKVLIIVNISNWMIEQQIRNDKLSIFIHFLN